MKPKKRVPTFEFPKILDSRRLTTELPKLLNSKKVLIVSNFAENEPDFILSKKLSRTDPISWWAESLFEKLRENPALDVNALNIKIKTTRRKNTYAAQDIMGIAEIIDSLRPDLCVFYINVKFAQPLLSLCKKLKIKTIWFQPKSKSKNLQFLKPATLLVTDEQKFAATLAKKLNRGIITLSVLPSERYKETLYGWYSVIVWLLIEVQKIKLKKSEFSKLTEFTQRVVQLAVS